MVMNTACFIFLYIYWLLKELLNSTSKLKLYLEKLCNQKNQQKVKSFQCAGTTLDKTMIQKE